MDESNEITNSSVVSMIKRECLSPGIEKTNLFLLRVLFNLFFCVSRTDSVIFFLPACNRFEMYNAISSRVIQLHVLMIDVSTKTQNNAIFH